MQDYIVSAIALDGTVRAFAAVTTNMLKEAREIHKLSPVASAALGRTLSAAAMMSKSLKGIKDTITIQIKGDGPLGGIVVVTDSQAKVRGYVYNPSVYLPLNISGKFDVSGAVGKKGYLNVIKDMRLKEPYIGYVDLVSGEIAEDIAYYFAYSEQIPSVVSLGVLVDSEEQILNSGGFIIQLMPGANDNTIDFLENKIKSIPPITKLMENGETPESILGIIFKEVDLKVIDKTACTYQCNCSRERMERNIISLGSKEIEKIIEEQHGVEAQCHFCNMKYYFSEDELNDFLHEQHE